MCRSCCHDIFSYILTQGMRCAPSRYYEQQQGRGEPNNLRRRQGEGQVPFVPCESHPQPAASNRRKSFWRARPHSSARTQGEEAPLVVVNGLFVPPSCAAFLTNQTILFLTFRNLYNNVLALQPQLRWLGESLGWEKNRGLSATRKEFEDGRIDKWPNPKNWNRNPGPLFG